MFHQILQIVACPTNSSETISMEYLICRKSLVYLIVLSGPRYQKLSIGREKLIVVTFLSHTANIIQRNVKINYKQGLQDVGNIAV